MLVISNTETSRPASDDESARVADAYKLLVEETNNKITPQHIENLLDELNLNHLTIVIKKESNE